MLKHNLHEFINRPLEPGPDEGVAMEEAGDLLVPMKDGLIGEDHIKGEIGAVAAGKIAGRSSADEITLFKTVGIAVQDVAMAFAVIAKADDLGLGVSVEL